MRSQLYATERRGDSVFVICVQSSGQWLLTVKVRDEETADQFLDHRKVVLIIVVMHSKLHTTVVYWGYKIANHKFKEMFDETYLTNLLKELLLLVRVE